MRTNEKVIKEISVGNVNIPISAKYIGDYEIGDIQDMIDDKLSNAGGTITGEVVFNVTGDETTTYNDPRTYINKDGIIVEYNMNDRRYTTITQNGITTPEITVKIEGDSKDGETNITQEGITSPKFITKNGTSSQFVRGNGSCSSLSKTEVTTALGLTPTANTGTVTSITIGKGLTGGTNGSITTSGSIKCNLNSETSLGTIGTTSKLYAVGVDANNKLCVNVPWSDTNTDTKVTSAANHYTPTENTDAAISASGGSATNITGTRGKLNVVTGLKRDAKGHIVGVTSANIYSTDNNTTYGLANLESNGLMSATTFTTMAEDSAMSSLDDILFETDPSEDKVLVYATQGVTYINYTTGERDYLTSGVVGTIDIPAVTTAKAGVMSAADKTKLDGIAAGANKYTLPNASSSTLGGVKIGSNISVSSGTISLTKANVTSALGYTPPTTNTTYSVATESTDGLLSKSIYSRMMGPSGWIINDFQDEPISITQAADNVKLNFNLSANRTKLGDGDTDDDNTLSKGSTTIPVATTSKAGVMSAADKMKFDQPFTGLVDGKGETVTMTSSPIRENNVPINEYLNLSLRALPGISVAFASYNSNAVVASPYLYKQAQRCALVLDKSQLNLIDYPTITWKTSAISGYGAPWKPDQDGYSLIYIPWGYQSITFKHTGENYNISVVGVHPTKCGGGYIFGGEWQYANEARTITLNNSDLYVILQAKKVDNSNIDPKLDVLSELGISITLNRSDNNICRGFVLDDGTQVYPVFKSAQNNDFNRICYYTNLSGTAVKPQLRDILDCLAAYCYKLDDGYYKIIVQDPSNADAKYGVFDVMKCLNLEVQDYYKYILDVTAMINLNTIQDAGNLEFGHIYGRIYAKVDMAGAFLIRSMSDNQWVYKR